MIQLIELTEIGLTFVRKHFEPVSEVEKEIWNDLSKDEQEQLLQLLDKLANKLKNRFAQYVKDKRKENI